MRLAAVVLRPPYLGSKNLGNSGFVCVCLPCTDDRNGSGFPNHVVLTTRFMDNIGFTDSAVFKNTGRTNAYQEIRSLSHILKTMFFLDHWFYRCFRLHSSKTWVKPMLSMNFVLPATWFETMETLFFCRCFSAASFKNIGRTNVFHKFRSLSHMF